MRIGLSTAAYFGALETEESAAHLQTLPIDCCEVFLQTFSEYTVPFAQTVRENLAGLRVSSIHTKTQHFETDLFSRSPRQRADAFHLFENVLEAGEVLGAKTYVFHGPAALRGRPPQFAAWADAINEAITIAARHGITFAWETVSWCHLNAPDRVHELTQACPAIHYVLDVKQALETGYDPVEYARAMGPLLVHVHVLDWDAEGQLTLPGLGGYDFARLARALRDIGYQGDVILEPYHAQLLANPTALPAAFAYLCATFAD